MKGLKVWTLLSVLMLAAAGCGSDNDDDDDNNSGGGGGGEQTPTTGQEIVLTSKMTFTTDADNGFETEGDDFDVDFNGSLRLPQQLDVKEGNSGVGWARLEVGDRKFCYRGNASDGDTADGSAYTLENEAFSNDIPCSELGNDSPDPVLSVDPDKDIEFEIETPGCSLGGGACEDTTVEARIDVLESDA